MNSYIVDKIDDIPTLILLGTDEQGTELYRVKVSYDDIPVESITQELMEEYKEEILLYLKEKLDLHFSNYGVENGSSLSATTIKAMNLYHSLSSLWARKNL